MKRVAIPFLMLLAACDPRPDIPPASDTGPAPSLLPQEQIDARIGGNLTDPSTQTALQARAAALKARAAGLR